MKDDEGLASVVGTMMAILIMVVILSLIMQFYVPSWMNDKEFNHSSKVNEEFAKMKANIDMQILREERELSVYTPITLGTEGIPVLSGATLGTIIVSPLESSFSIYNDTKELNLTSKGKIEYLSENRYYIKQNYAYENGAVILNQSKGELVKVTPQFQVSNLTATGLSISLSMISLSGESQSARGTGTFTVQTRLLSIQSEHYAWSNGENLTIKINSTHSNAWSNYINSTLSKEGLSYGNDYTILHSQNEIYITIKGVKSLSAKLAVVEVKLE